MRDRDEYTARQQRLQAFLAEDDDRGSSIRPGQRFKAAQSAVRDLHAGVSRLDPLFGEAWARFLEIHELARPKSATVKETIGVTVRQVCETHGPDHALVERLRNVQWSTYSGFSKRSFRKLERAIDEHKELQSRAEPGHRYILAIMNLADLFLEGGQYFSAVKNCVRVVNEGKRVGLDPALQIAFTRAAALRLFDRHGEVVKALPMLEEVLAADETRYGTDPRGTELFMLSHERLQLAQCYLATAQPRRAETVLRECLDRLRHRRAFQHSNDLYLLFHEATYELGSALWKQHRPTEAAAALAEAWDLVQTDRLAGGWRRAPYRTAITYIEVAGDR
jgi:tetratricopeptide (TPR) repeat protein